VNQIGGGGERANQEFNFGHAKFGQPIPNPDGNVK